MDFLSPGAQQSRSQWESTKVIVCYPGLASAWRPTSSDQPLEHLGYWEITRSCTAELFQFLQVRWAYSHIVQRHQTGQQIWTGLGKPGTGSYTPSRPGPVQALGTVPMLYCLQWWTELCCWSPSAVVPSLQLCPSALLPHAQPHPSPSGSSLQLGSSRSSSLTALSQHLPHLHLILFS